jgi:hypothetical protein
VRVIGRREVEFGTQELRNSGTQEETDHAFLMGESGAMQRLVTSCPAIIGISGVH